MRRGEERFIIVMNHDMGMKNMRIDQVGYDERRSLRRKRPSSTYLIAECKAYTNVQNITPRPQRKSTYRFWVITYAKMMLVFDI